MLGVFRLRSGASVVVLVSLFVGVAAWILLAGGAMRPRQQTFSQLNELRPTGYPQLISVDPLPEAESAGEMCQWVPASSQTRLIALPQQETLAARADAATPAGARASVTLVRSALRSLRDPFPTYSAVAVDARNNEIVLQDENLFQIMVYDRTANTPPTASLTEPKRVISGAEVEFNCALYIDPKNGDIYSVSNDTMETVSVFSRNARGNVHPDREFHTPIRTYGIAVDEANEELFLTVQSPPMVLVYRKYAKGDEKPIRMLRGNKTGLGDAHGIGLDIKNGWMFVASYGSISDYKNTGGSTIPKTYGDMVSGSGRFEPPSITVYPIKAGGDTPPLRTIQGPKTQLNWPAHMYVDDAHGEVYVANDGDDSILVFRVTDSGDAAPTRVIKGPKTQIKNPTGVFVDAKNDELWVSNMGNHRATVYPRTASGDVPPKRMIRSAPPDKLALAIGNPGAVAYDTHRAEILVPN